MQWCWWCGELIVEHRLLGVSIDVDDWHKIWSGKGVQLKPSDALMPRIPQQRRTSPHISLVQPRVNGKFVRKRP